MIAILIETSEGSYIWDCAAYIGLPLISYLSSLSKPLKAIAISHPHVRAISRFAIQLMVSSSRPL